MRDSLTVPWHKKELLRVGPFLLYYHANHLGVIEHVFLPGGRRVDYDFLRTLGHPITPPAIVRLPSIKGLKP